MRYNFIKCPVKHNGGRRDADEFSGGRVNNRTTINARTFTRFLENMEVIRFRRRLVNSTRASPGKRS